jgi:enamine deaminase RidA (YjgF/YER057c/UK114 family)
VRSGLDNIREVLRSANMEIADLVKVTTFLSDRCYAVENREIRQRQLGTATPALTVIIADIFDSAWLLEIEAVAATSD